MNKNTKSHELQPACKDWGWEGLSVANAAKAYRMHVPFNNGSGEGAGHRFSPPQMPYSRPGQLVGF